MQQLLIWFFPMWNLLTVFHGRNHMLRLCCSLMFVVWFVVYHRYRATSTLFPLWFEEVLSIFRGALNVSIVVFANFWTASWNKMVSVHQKLGKGITAVTPKWLFSSLFAA